MNSHECLAVWFGSRGVAVLVGCELHRASGFVPLTFMVRRHSILSVSGF